MEESIRVETDLDVTEKAARHDVAGVGDRPVIEISSGERVLADTVQQKYTVGTYEVAVQPTIKNGTFANWTERFDLRTFNVVSPTDVAVINQGNYTAALAFTAIGSVGAAIWTAFLIKKQLNATEKSNELTRESLSLATAEVRAKSRPRFEFRKIEGILVSRANGTTEMRLIATVRNGGYGAARKVERYHGQLSYSTNHIEEIVPLRTKMRETTVPMGTILPDGETEIVIRFEGTRKTNLIPIALWFEYTYLDKQEAAVAAIQLKAGSDKLDYVWYIQEDIDEASGKKKS